VIENIRPWKKELLKNVNILSNLLKLKRWTEPSRLQLEKSLFISFYIIRKLIESQKISKHIINIPITIKIYLPKGVKITRLNMYDLEVIYELHYSEDCEKCIEFICNEFIHSYIFVDCLELSRFSIHQLSSVYVTSRKERCNQICCIQINTIIDIINTVVYS